MHTYANLRPSTRHLVLRNDWSITLLNLIFASVPNLMPNAHCYLPVPNVVPQQRILGLHRGWLRPKHRHFQHVLWHCFFSCHHDEVDAEMIPYCPGIFFLIAPLWTRRNRVWGHNEVICSVFYWKSLLISLQTFIFVIIITSLLLFYII